LKLGEEISGYRWGGSELTRAHGHLLPVFFEEVEKLSNLFLTRGGGTCV